MEFRSIGDLAGSLQLSQGSTTTKAEISRLVEELSTGLSSDTGKAVAGDFSMLSSLSADTYRLDAYQSTVSEAEIFFSAAQNALSSVQEGLTTFGANMISASSSGSDSQMSATTVGAADAFANAVSAMNIEIGGKSVFAGTATNAPPLASSSVILEELNILVAGLSTASDVQVAIDDWFDSVGGGFETGAYMGSSNDLAPFQLNEMSEVSFGISAADPEIRELLKGLATAALIGAAELQMSVEERAELSMTTGSRLIASDDAVTLVRAKLGSSEEKIETASVQNEYETSAIEIWKNEILGVDEYRAATELQAAETQLQLLYTLTARLSQLSLSDYL